MATTIEWISEDESNTPRAEVSGLKVEPDLISLLFKGAEAGQETSWSGSISLVRTTDVQTVVGHYDEVPGPKLHKPIRQIPYSVTGRFADDTCKSFTGRWSEGIGSISVYELNIDID